MMRALTKNQYECLIKSLKENGQLTTSGVLNSAKDENSPLHNIFEWDDQKAGHEYRLIQARQIIRKLNVHIEKNEDQIVHVPAIKGEGAYKTMSNVVSNISEFEMALTEAVKRLKSSEKAVNELHAIAQTESPDKAHILAIAMKGLQTAENALNKLH